MFEMYILSSFKYEATALFNISHCCLPTGASSSIPAQVPLAHSIAPIKAIVPERLDCRRRIRSPTVIHSGRFVASSLMGVALLEEV